MTMTLPEGVTVHEQWAVHSDDGQIYRVHGDLQAVAEHEAELLRQGRNPDPGEPGSAVAHRYVMSTPSGVVATDWCWTVSA